MDSIEQILNEAYLLLERVTPLRTDCGRLCERRCCQSGEEEMGMYLFPGEETRLAGAGFLRIEPSDFEYRPGKPVWFAACDGWCDRSLRPLACRIFPLTPYLTAKGIVITKIDPRAIAVCPIARQLGPQELNPRFFNAVRRVGQLLAGHHEFQTYLEWLTGVMADYEIWQAGKSPHPAGYKKRQANQMAASAYNPIKQG